jgi:hypothetical protein
MLMSQSPAQGGAGPMAWVVILIYSTVFYEHEQPLYKCCEANYSKTEGSSTGCHYWAGQLPYSSMQQ